MKTLTFYVALLVFSFAHQQVAGQEKEYPSEKERRAKIEDTKNETIEEITKDEKNKLKRAVRYINYQITEGNLSNEKGEKQKKDAAKTAAKNIENRIAIAENEAQLLLRKKRDTTEINGSYMLFWKLAENGKIADFTLKKRINDDEFKEPESKRTTSDIVLAFGFNNALADGQTINDSDFKLGGSRFFEIGWAWKTRVFNNSNWLRVKYGLSFQFNGLKPTENRYFVQDEDITRLEISELDLDKSKFRMDNLVVPVHFEIGPSKTYDSNGYKRFTSDGEFKIGLGGYGGFNIGERQKLKYNENGDNQKRKNKSSFNTNSLVYGLSSYISFGGTAIYAKYDLNPIFESPNKELHNFSLGLRFDVD